MRWRWFGPAVTVIAVLAVAGCGSESGDQAETTASSATTPQSTQSSRSPAASSTPAPAADGECSAGTAVTVASTNGGYPGGIDWSSTHAVAERPYAGLGGDGRAIVVYISTTERPLGELTDRKIDLAPDEGFLELTFTNGEQDAGSGDYAASVDTTAPNRFNLDIHVTDRTTVNLDNNKSTGTAQLTESGGTVCGSFEIADKWTSASGTFVAPVEAT